MYAYEHIYILVLYMHLINEKMRTHARHKQQTADYNARLMGKKQTHLYILNR